MHKGTGTLCIAWGLTGLMVSRSHEKNPVLYFVYLFNFYINIYIKQ